MSLFTIKAAIASEIHRVSVVDARKIRLCHPIPYLHYLGVSRIKNYLDRHSFRGEDLFHDLGPLSMPSFE